MELQKIQIENIKPYERNARKNDKAVAAVAESIKQCGYIAPIIVDETMTILAGHTRLKALQKLGRKTAEVAIKEGLTEEQKRKYRLLDNKTAEIAEWDLELLEQELEGLDFGDLDLEWGIQEEAPEVIEDDYGGELPEEPRTKPGEIYELGQHRLICGDSTNPADIEALMAGEKADLVVTDPPYNVDYTGKTKDALKIENDRKTEESFTEFLSMAFENLSDSLKEGGAFYIWHPDSGGRIFRNVLQEAGGLEVRQALIWAKNVMVLGRQDYQWQHEPCLYGWKEGAAHYFIDDRTQTTLIEDARPDIAKMKKAEMQELLEKIYDDKISTTIIHEKKPAASRLHPTMKPVVLMGRLIKNSSRTGEIVLDLFGGSGSTMMAAEQLGRRCFMAEYDPKYCDVIIDRWQQLTGRTATQVGRI